MKELEERVKKSDDEVRMVRYQLDMEKRRSAERERLLEAEISRLQNELVKVGHQSQLASQMAARSGHDTGASNRSAPSTHPMALHRFTSNQNLTYK